MAAPWVVLALATGLACAAERPRIAIVIDDLGYQDDRDRAVLALDSRVAVAIIPEAPAARQVARLAGQQQREVLVHLPLAGLYHDNCQPVLTCIGIDWPADRMQMHLEQALERVEGAIGINNHQGSLFTSDKRAVGNLVAGIGAVGRERGQPLFVLDSRTSATTVLERKARNAGLEALRRHVFLDHSDDPEQIGQAWEQLLALARANGSAVAIGHPRTNTIHFLQQALPELETTDLRLVPISALLGERTNQARPGEVFAESVASP